MGFRPFFSFYGGKWRDAPKYPAPRHSTIIEPFAGSAGYSVRHHHLKVVLCEKDPEIAAVWQYLLRVRPEEILRIGDVDPGQTVDDLRCCQEARLLVGLWLNRGASAPRKSPSKWMRSGVRPGSFWGPRVRDTIAAQVDRIRHWTLIEGSYEALQNTHATWYIDPPYQKQGNHYRCGSGQIDYEHLARWSRGRSGLSIVCEAVGASWLPFKPFADVKATRTGTRSKEAIWTSS